MNINEKAAQWWAARLQIEEKREQFKGALLKILEESPDWYNLYVDYDPEEELLDAVCAAGIECKGFMFSAEGIFPAKTGLRKRGDKLMAKEGYGALYVEI